MASHPSRVRGLKSLIPHKPATAENVAPLAGAWIEMLISSVFSLFVNVAPLAGAWIEIVHGVPDLADPRVAPLAGAWIEIRLGRVLQLVVKGRTPRGCVD